jgi:hypothetical protein
LNRAKRFPGFPTPSSRTMSFSPMVLM